MQSNLLLILLALFLVLLNGFFVAAEFSLVKLRQTRVRAIAKTQGWRGQILSKVHGQLDAYLSACQLGITLASLGLGWVGEPAFAELLEPLLHQAGVDSPEIIHGISFIIAFFTISYLHIVLGELAPKSMAIRQAEQVGLWTAAPLYAFYWMMYPAIWVLNTSSNWILHKVGLSTGHASDAHYSADELKLILRSSRASEELTKDEWNILAHTLDFSDLEVADLMRPFNEAISLSAENSLEENMEIISQHRYSRYPFVERDGKVKGVIHLKSLFLAKFEAEELQDLGRYIHPAPFVAPDMPAIELFRRFREGKASHFAIVGRKGQEPLGFITLDNMLGALVGEIRDEFRQSQNDWTKLDDGTLIGKGSLPIFTLERALGVEIDNVDEVDSVGGLVLSKLEDIPKEGDSISFGPFDIVIKKMNGPRIILVRIHPRQVSE